MSTIIYYFTGTGNSLEVAERLAKQLNADIASMVALNEPLAGYDTVGVVFPTYMYRPPILVVDFLRQLSAVEYLFVVAVNGGDPGDVLLRTSHLLAQSEVPTHGLFQIRLPSNYTPFGAPLPLKEQETLFKAAWKKVNSIASKVQQKTPFCEPKPSWFNTHIHPALWYKLGYWAIPQSDKGFRLNDQCVACGSCAKVCPVQNIKREDGKPVWQNRCQQCLACFQWCNKQAIELGKKTQGVPRYHNPHIKRRQIIAQKKDLPKAPQLTAST